MLKILLVAAINLVQPIYNEINGPFHSLGIAQDVSEENLLVVNMTLRAQAPHLNRLHELLTLRITPIG